VAIRKLRLLVVAVLLLVSGGVGAYLFWRPRPVAIPPIATDGLDTEVIRAIDEARRAVEAQPRSAAAWGRLGMVLFAQDMYADCIAILTEAERLDPKEARWPYFRGLAVILLDPNEGLTHLERAAHLAPSNLSVRLRLAEQYLKLERIDEADALFRELLREHPDNPRVLLGRGQILSRRGQWQDALEPLQIAAAHPTARRSARVALAEACSRLGSTAAADSERRLAAEVPADTPWPDQFFAEARAFRTGLQPRLQDSLALSDQGRYDAALILIGQVLRDHPDSDEAHLNLAKILIRQQRYELAEDELRQALTLNPDLIDAHFQLAGILMLHKNYDAAERSYLRTVALKPNHGLAHYNLGYCRLQQGRKAEAIASFRDALRSRPDLAAAHLELGALLLQDGQIKEASGHLEQATRLDDKNERARRLLEQARAREKP
jgi:tetratricopeptide (TPR) repeat protein